MRPWMLLLPVCVLHAQTPAEHFESRVRPLLATRCYGCHGPDQQQSNLRVDSRDALLHGGKRGPAITPGQTSQSLLIQALKHQGDLKMPAGGRLKDTEIAAIEQWIRDGAPWPKTATSTDHYTRLVRGHWAFQPLKPSALTIDAAIRSRLTKEALTPAKPADRRTLARRLSYVLTGLPPSPEDVTAFEADKSPQAYEKLVDRLLASSHFGEQWARHWMDLVRYGETRGYEWNYEVLGAWRYRDYLIRAFNSDVPYNQFVREHIAGDLLSHPRINPKEHINESIIGTAFYRLGEAGHDDCIQFREIALDVIDNQIDTITKTFQGLTVSCARCHNHKLDPIPTDDYYALYGILNSSHHVTQTIDAPDANAASLSKLRALQPQIRNELAGLWRKELTNISKALTDTDSFDDPAFAWSAAKKGWIQSAVAFGKEATDRAEYNRANFEPLRIQDWNASGEGLRTSGPGAFSIAAGDDAAITGIYPAGLYTHLDSSRLNGALRLPQLPTRKKFISILAMGGMLGSHRVIIDNCAIGEGYKVLESDALSWQKTAIRQGEGPSAYLELITRFDNPRIPDRPGVLKAPQLKLLETPRSYFGITQAVLHDIDAAPKPGLNFLLPLFDGPPEQLMERYQNTAAAAIDRWSRNQATDDDVRWLDWLLRKQVLTNSHNATPRLATLLDAYREAESQIQEPRVIEGLADIGPYRDFPVLISGSPLNPGAPASRTFLRYLFGAKPLATSGSGRRELADVIASNDNPLTARVMVNRIWHHVFGRGLVGTVDNFGLIGDRPSHPELLDSLAAQFIENGWSMKRFIRTLVLSETFRQSSEASPRSRELDPQNALLQHYTLRRLSAEELRDSILAASGTLRADLYGPSIQPFRDKPQDYRRLFSGPLDGNGRRSLYLKVTRMEGTKFLETFDYPVPMATRGARDVTNVPAQALTLLNDPFIIAEAARLAARAKNAGVTFDERLAALFRFTLNRAPSPQERERFNALSQKLDSLGTEPWPHLAHAALNLKEFLYIQ